MRIVPNDKRQANEGDVFSELVVVGLPFYIKEFQYVVCKCSCNNFTCVRTLHLRDGHTRSCGCLAKIQKGLTNTRIYKIFQGMKSRCLNKKDISYKNYGGRGITICKEWLENFSKFYNWAISNGYQVNLTIERIDNNQGYSPNNCRWATRQEQNHNYSKNKIITIFGQTKNLKQWSQDPRCNVSYQTLYQRISVLNWEPERAITQRHRYKKYHVTNN